VLLILTAVVTFGYSGVSIYIATRLADQAEPPLKITRTPAALGLAYADVSFPSRDDHLTLRGWFIPGLLPSGLPTDQRVIVMVHGSQQNRTDPAAGLLDLSGALVHHGFAVLTFDMRGHGDSQPAPWSLGYYEQRDVLGAVDFLRSGPLPYPELGRPRVIGGWGVSMGANSLLMAAGQESAIAAIVADSSYPDILPILQREIPKGGVPASFTPGGLLATRVLYGVDFYDTRPIDALAHIAPRPIFFIQGGADSFNPPSNLGVLTAAAKAAPNDNVLSWLVPGADHAQAYHVAGSDYVNRVVAFYDRTLGAA
jgi:pimeloyl-ACP methyl ester carboxylesterase